MSKRLRKMEYDVKMNQEGRGQGEGKDYKALYNNQDVVPMTRTTRTQDNQTGRKAFALSDQELRLRKLIEYGGNVISIDELYPINLDESSTLASELGIEHPMDFKTKKRRPIVITMLVTKRTKQGKEKTIAVKYVKVNSLVNKSVINQLEIIRKWCVQQQYSLMIVTEEKLDSVLIRNISNLHNYLPMNSWEWMAATKDEKIDIMSEFLMRAVEDDNSERELCSSFGKKYDVELGEVINLYKHLIANKVIKVDLSQVWDMSKAMRQGVSYEKFKHLIRRYKENGITEYNL